MYTSLNRFLKWKCHTQLWDFGPWGNRFTRLGLCGTILYTTNRAAGTGYICTSARLMWPTHNGNSVAMLAFSQCTIEHRATRPLAARCLPLQYLDSIDVVHMQRQLRPVYNGHAMQGSVMQWNPLIFPAFCTTVVHVSWMKSYCRASSSAFVY